MPPPGATSGVLTFDCGIPKFFPWLFLPVSFFALRMAAALAPTAADAAATTLMAIFEPVLLLAGVFEEIFFAGAFRATFFAGLAFDVDFFATTFCAGFTTFLAGAAFFAGRATFLAAFGAAFLAGFAVFFVLDFAIKMWWKT